MISWHDPQWFFGEKGAGWFRQGGAGSLNFSSTYKMKGLEKLEINWQYIEFMKAIIISEIFTKNMSLSGIALDKRLNVLKCWYHELFILTSQTSPIYLTADIAYSAMKRHYDNSSSKSNVSDYCDIAVLLARILRTQNFTLLSTPKRKQMICDYQKRQLNQMDMDVNEIATRKVIYTTNAIESVHRQFRKLTKTKGAFPNENSLLKLLYLGLLNAQEKWTMPIQNWNLALSQLSIYFEGRLDNVITL